MSVWSKRKIISRLNVSIIPSKLQRLCLKGDQVGRLYVTYSSDIHVAEDIFVREIQRWRTRWGMMDEKPSTLAKTLSLTNKDLYPSIYAILSILVTMSSSLATAERLFSAMKRIQNYLRSTMGNGRLSSLGLLHVHREIEIDVERVIELFASLKNRKLAFF